MSGARVYVCALSKVAQTVHESNAGSLITLLTAGSVIERPDMIAPERHLVRGTLRRRARMLIVSLIFLTPGTVLRRLLFIAMPASAGRQRRPILRFARWRQIAAKPRSRKSCGAPRQPQRQTASLLRSQTNDLDAVAA